MQITLITKVGLLLRVPFLMKRKYLPIIYLALNDQVFVWCYLNIWIEFSVKIIHLDTVFEFVTEAKGFFFPLQRWNISYFNN